MSYVLLKCRVKKLYIKFVFQGSLFWFIIVVAVAKFIFFLAFYRYETFVILQHLGRKEVSKCQMLFLIVLTKLFIFDKGNKNKFFSSYFYPLSTVIIIVCLGEVYVLFYCHKYGLSFQLFFIKFDFKSAWCITETTVLWKC